MPNSKQDVYATIADSTTLMHALTAFHSLRAMKYNSVLYLLCTEQSVYTAVECMEYDDVYMISLSELQERYPELYDIQTTPKKYHSILHAFLLHYIIYYNPLVYGVHYISPYTYWLLPIQIYNTNTCTLLDAEYTAPYYLYIPNTIYYKELLQQYQRECIRYALDITRAYTEHRTLRTLFVDMCENVDYTYQTLLFTHEEERIRKKGDSLIYLNERAIIGLYTRYLLCSRFLFSSVTHIRGGYCSLRSLARSVALYKKELQRMQYKCTLFGLAPTSTILPHKKIQYKNAHCYWL